MILILFGVGVVAQVVTGGKELGTVPGSTGDYNSVAWGWGLGVCLAVFVAGRLSGAHLNPAVTVGLAMAGRVGWNTVPGYIAAQVLGGIAAAVVLYLIVSGKADFTGVGGFASNGFGEHSPGKFSLMSALITEVVLTAMFLVVILGVTHKNAPAGFAPLAIGLALTLIHLISIPVTNTSVNPARSTAVALFAEPWALQQLWLFWVAPIVGAIIGALVHKVISED